MLFVKQNDLNSMNTHTCEKICDIWHLQSFHFPFISSECTTVFLKMKMVFIISLMMMVMIMVQAECPSNCICGETSTCVLSDCYSPMVFDGSELRLAGVLCRNHYTDLRERYSLKKVLQDSPCLSLRNCK